MYNQTDMWMSIERTEESAELRIIGTAW